MTITLSGRRRRGVLAAFVLVISIAAVIATSGQSSLASSDEGSDADGPAALEGRHLYLVPDTPEGAVATEVVNARVVAGYDAFTLVSADARPTPCSAPAGADRRDDMRSVVTEAGKLNPAAARPAPPRASRWRWSSSSARSRTPGSTRCAGPARVVAYTAQNAYVVCAGAPRRSPSSPGRRGARRDPVHRADKTAPGMAGPGTVSVAVQTLAGARGPPRESPRRGRRAAAAGGPRRRAHQVRRLDADRVAELAADPGVVASSPRSSPNCSTSARRRSSRPARPAAQPQSAPAT